MGTEKVFCQKCERRLNTGGPLKLISKGEKIHEFKDGYYCDNCAKVKIEEARKNGNQGTSPK